MTPAATDVVVRGPALIQHLESVQVEDGPRHLPMRLPVQWVNRPNQDFRGFTGQIASGRVAVGDRIRALPAGVEARVARIVTYDGELAEAVAGQSITLTLDREIDISRGDVVVTADDPPRWRPYSPRYLIMSALLPSAICDEIGPRTITPLPGPRHRVNSM